MESKCGQGRPYQITIKGRQNITRGQYADRRLLINGEVPFREVENIPFSFSSIWQNFTLGDETTVPVLPERGENTIRMEVVLGDGGNTQKG